MITLKTLKPLLELGIQQAALTHAKCILGISLKIQLPNPLHLYTNFDKTHFYIHQPSNAFKLLGLGSIAECKSYDLDRFKTLNKSVAEFYDCYQGVALNTEEVPQLYVLSNFTFESITHKDSEPSGNCWIPEFLIIQKEESQTLHVYICIQPKQGLEAFGSYVDRVNQLIWWHSLNNMEIIDNSSIDSSKYNDTNDLFINQLKKGLSLIAAGSCNKIVLAQERIYQLKDNYDPLMALINISKNPIKETTLFSIQKNQGITFLGITPERLLITDGYLLQTEILAGSCARGNAEQSDEELFEKAYNKDQIQKEHAYTLEYIKEQLFPYSSNIVFEPTKALILPYIQHLKTPCLVHLLTETPALTLLGILHPTPAVCGYPKKNANKAIQKIETFSRGYYGGCFGWMTNPKIGEWWVNIRCCLINKKQIHMYAGVGLVDTSIIGKELNEISLKFQALNALFTKTNC